MLRNDSIRSSGAIRLGLLLGLGIATLLAGVVLVVGYTTNREVEQIFDRSETDSRAIAVDNVSRFAQLLATNTALTVQPSVLDHNYSYIRTVLSDMTESDDGLLYIAVRQPDGQIIEQSGSPDGGARVVRAGAPVVANQETVGTVELVYDMTAVEARIAAAHDENEARRSESIRNLIIGGAITLVVGMLMAAGLGMWLARPVTRMAHAAWRLGEGRFDVRVDVGGSLETRQLARTFNSMAGQLEASLAASIERAAVDREIELAHQLQRQMMPPEDRIVLDDVEIIAWYSPAGTCAGDWWTVTPSARGEPHWIMIGDVMGHGIPAALFTAAAQSAYRTAGVLGADHGPDRILATIHAALRGFAQTRTMSCCAATLDPATGRLSVSVGGHPSPLWFRRDDTDVKMEVLEGTGPLLGDAEPTCEFSQAQYDLRTGDLVVLYTDGIIEATNARERMFGVRRLARAISPHATAGLDEIMTSIKQSFSDHVGDVVVEDDVTVVVIRYLGHAGGTERASS